MNSNISYWEKDSFFEADVIIVGSGIVGLNAAITLKQQSPKISVIVLERGFLPAGASTKNAGFACFGSISELIQQEKIQGTDGLYHLISKRWKGLLKLRSLLGDQHMAFENFGGFELFMTNQQGLKDECVHKISHFNTLIADIVNKKDTYSVQNRKIEAFGFKGVDELIACSLEGQLNPGLMMKALIAKANSLGVNIYNACKVEKIESETAQQIVKTNQGIFKCKKVLLCNNAFVNELYPSLAVIPGRGQVVITKPIENLKVRGTFHYDEGYYYFRNVGNRLLLGGGRNLDFKTEETTQFGTTLLVQDELRKLISTVILPNTSFEIEQTWSGIMAFGEQLNPIVKEIATDIYCAVRCNGMGIAIGSQTGAEAGEMILKSL